MNGHARLALLFASAVILVPNAAAAAPPDDAPGQRPTEPGVPAFERTIAPGQSFRIDVGDEEGTFVEAGVSDPELLEEQGTTGGGIQPLSHLPAYCATWYEKEGTLVWEEKHTGKFCYNGANVWISNGHYPNKDGYHHCDQGWGIGWVITVTNCDEVKGETSGGKKWLDNIDNFKTSYAFKGSPITVSHWMKARAWEGGAMTFTGDLK